MTCPVLESPIALTTVHLSGVNGWNYNGIGRVYMYKFGFKKKRKKEIRISLGQVRVFSHELNEVVGSYTHITRKQPIITCLLNQRGAFDGTQELTSDRLRVKRCTHGATPPFFLN